MTRRRSITCTAKSGRVKPFYVMELLEKAQTLEAKGVDVVHMEVGEPDFPTPPSIRESAVKAIRDGRTFYTHSLGLKELRERIALHYAESRGVKIPPGRVIVTNGTSGPFFSSLPFSSIGGGTSSSPIPDTPVTATSAPSSMPGSSPYPSRKTPCTRSPSKAWKNRAQTLISS